MKYENNAHNRERWGTAQANAKAEVVTSIVGNGSNTNDLGGTMTWTDPATGGFHSVPWNVSAQEWYKPVYEPIAPEALPPFQPYDGAQAKAELEVLRHSLSFCLICGLDQVFILCSLCRETVKGARQKMLDEMVESVRSIGG